MLRGHSDRRPVEIPFGADDEVAELAACADLAAVDEPGVVGVPAQAVDAVRHVAVAQAPRTAEAPG